MSLSALSVVAAFFFLCTGSEGEDEFPWVHYFERPDMASIHCALADPEGSIIVSTGDWDSTYYDPPWIVYPYRSKGMHRIDRDLIETISCPPRTFVLDYAIDSENEVWVLFGEAIDERVLGYESAQMESYIGYRRWRFPVSRWPYISNPRLALVDGAQLTQCQEVTELVPGDLVMLSSGPDGWVVSISWERSDEGVLSQFVSWWDRNDPASVHVLSLSGLYPRAGISAYPEFAPNGLVYVLISYLESSSPKRAVLCVDPQRGEHFVYDSDYSPFLDSVIEYFHVDRSGARWIGTIDGLVLLGEKDCSRFTTDNSELPYNLVLQIEYDEIDHVYYVVSKAREPRDPEHYAAFSIFSATGQPIGRPVDLPWVPKIQRDGRGIWYLMLDPRNANDTIHSYDHTAVREWHLRDWVDVSGDVRDLYIGPTSDGRTFLVTRTCVMIW